MSTEVGASLSSGLASHWATALLPGLLVALVVAVWPRRRRARTERRRRALECAPVGGPEPARPGRLAAVGSLWRADPVELLRAHRLRRRPEALLAGALDLLSAIGAALEAGLPPARAVEVAAGTVVGADRLHVLLNGPAASGAAATGPRGPGRAAGAAPVAGLAADLVRAGRAVHPLSRVWAEWAARSGSEELAFVAAAWRLSERTGAPLAAAVERAARGLRDVRRRRGRVAAAVAGPRATVALLTALPLAGPVLGLACGVHPRTLYLGSPLSVAAVTAGVGLLLLGRWWCRRLVRGVTAP